MSATEQLLLIPDMKPAWADFSPCGTWRYRCGRRWAPGKPLLWVLLNPSVATDSVPDPTLRKVMGFSHRYGYGAMEIVNLFAYVAQEPSDLVAFEGDRVGPDADRWIARALEDVADVVCGWGANADRPFVAARVPEVERLILTSGRRCFQLGPELTTGGHPLHPLMQPYRLPLTPRPPGCG